MLNCGDLGIKEETLIKKHQVFVLTVNVNGYFIRQANGICTVERMLGWNMYCLFLFYYFKRKQYRNYVNLLFLV